MTTKVINKKEITLEEKDEKNEKNEEYEKYIGGKHIFMMCPMSETLLKDIEKEIDEAIKADQNLYIHIQGEASQGGEVEVVGEAGLVGTTIVFQCNYTKMTTKVGGGFFGEAFNLYSGGVEIQRFREIVKSNEIRCFAVKPSVKDGEGNIVKVGDKVGDEIDREIPKFYADAYNDILYFSTIPTTAPPPPKLKSKYNNLNVLKVYQDLTDKDNLASLAMIGHLVNPSDRIMLGLVGFRIYSSTSKPIPEGGDILQSSFSLPFKFGTFGEDAKEVFKPADKTNGKGNVEFLTDLTQDFYERASRGFFDIINEHCPEKFHKENLGIVDGGTETFSKSLRSPFNMSLYYFPEDTHMKLEEKKKEKELINPPSYSSEGGGKSRKKVISKTPHHSYNFSKSKSVIRNNTRKKRKSKKPNK